MKIRYFSTLGLTCLALLSPYAASAEESSALAFSTGVFDIDEDDNTAEFGLEYRFSPLKNTFDIIPVAGISASVEGNYWLYTGVRYDINLNDNWVLTPHFAVALYEQGGSKDLGYDVEFRSGLELAYKLNASSHLGLGLYHLSNASMGDDNPGSESIIISYSFSPSF